MLATTINQQINQDLLFRYQPELGYGAPPGVPTISAPAGRTYHDVNGVVQTAGSNILREAHYHLGVRTTLLEGSHTNGLTYSQDFSHANWVKVDQTITADAIAAPDGTTTADAFIGTATTSAKTCRQLTTITDNLVSGLSVYVKPGVRTWIKLGLRGNDGSVRSCYFNLAGAGAIGSFDTNVFGYILAMANGWYRCIIRAPNGAGAAGTQAFYMYTVTGDANDVTTGNGTTVDMYVWGAQLEIDTPWSSSYVPTTTAAVTMTAETVYWNNAIPLIASTVYCKFIDRGTYRAAQRRLWQISTAGLYLASGGFVAVGEYDSAYVGAYTSSGNGPASGITYFDTVEVRTVYAADGSVTTGVSVNGGAETVGSAGITGTPPAVALQPVALNSGAGGDFLSNYGFASFIAFKVIPNTQTLATMRAA